MATSRPSRVGRGGLVLRHSTPHFPPAFEASHGIQYRALLRHKSEEMKILNISFPRVGIELTTCHVYSHTLCATAPLLASGEISVLVFLYF